MVRLSQMPEPERSYMARLHCPTFETQPWVKGPSLKERRVAIISTAGVHCRGDRSFDLTSEDYRIIPGDIQANDLIMTHISANFDRVGFQQDWNVIFPLDRLCELASQGKIGSVADYHYSFMGATDPGKMEPTVRHLAGVLKNDQVNAVLLVPV
ncbi:MAG: selenoprotein B glycine/betaine/sarcosine/D-proline reductase [Deltaproteobacteria bacterium]|nr:selenoprotein B glycine/betaine/sarcosine/D-proline reductase [Deltaproteobacteria bacterium]MBW2087096.1 selenoprotein B glycine/betaine/sarcosine/D-proline reductase [Deltaproteobacteria bacterium]